MAISALRLEEEAMPWYDLPEEQLKDYRTDTPEPADLDRWWQLRLDEARAAAREPALTRHETGTYAPVEVYDTEFSGAGGDRIRAWYLRPAGGPDTGRRTVVKFTAGKEITVHPFTGHEVPTTHVERQLRHLREFLG
jgi:hypothetical protein